MLNRPRVKFVKLCPKITGHLKSENHLKVSLQENLKVMKFWLAQKLREHKTIIYDSLTFSLAQSFIDEAFQKTWLSVLPFTVNHILITLLPLGGLCVGNKLISAFVERRVYYSITTPRTIKNSGSREKPDGVETLWYFSDYLDKDHLLV